MNVVRSRRSTKRTRSAPRVTRMAVQRVSRSLRYNGENKITRTVTGTIPYTAAGFGVGAAFFQALNIVYDPTSVTFYGSAVTNVSFAIPNAAELAALYDQVKIDKVELTWSGTHIGTANLGGTGAALKFLVCNDNNDGIGAASLTEIQQQPNKEYYAIDGRSFKWNCSKPQYQRLVYQTGLVSNYEPTTGFVNSNSTIPHYGTKIVISNITSINPAQTGNVDFNIKFFLTLKNVK